jgi:hypothetical protein
MGTTDKGFVEGTASNYMNSWQWASDQNIWGLQGIAQTAMGLGNITGGALTGNTNQIGSGFSQIGNAVKNTVGDQMVDVFGVAIGQASHLYTVPRDLYNLGKSFFDNKKYSTLQASGALLGHLIIPRYGLYGGAGWGYDDKTGKHTLGALDAYPPLNDTDTPSKKHDENLLELAWVKGQVSMLGDPRISGVGGLAYKALGIIPFGVWGLISD